MIARFALVFSLAALALATAGLVLVGGRVIKLGKRVTALEKKPVPAVSAEPAPPDDRPPDVTPRQGMTRIRARQMADRESKARLDTLIQRLDAEETLAAKLRASFRDEHEYFAEGIVRSLEALQRDDSDEQGLASPEFRKGLEERIAATDAKVRELLSGFQAEVFDQWRREIRKDPYELD